MEKEFFQGMRLQIVIGSRYIGGFIGDGVAEKNWLESKVEGWADYLGTLAEVSRKQP